MKNTENNESKHSYRNLPRLVFTTIFLCFSSFYYGYTLAFFSTLNERIISQVFGDQANKVFFHSLLIAISPACAIIGAFTAPLLLKYFTRKQSILCINLLALIIQISLQITHPTALLINKAFQGFCIGNYMGIISLYVHQICPKTLMGSMGVFVEFISQIGVVFAYLLGIFLSQVGVQSYVYYRIMSLIIIVFIVVQSVLLITDVLPQSPVSLIAQKKYQKAQQVISLFNSYQESKKFFQHKKMLVELENSSLNAENRKKPIKYSKIAYFIAFQIIFMQQMTGKNALVTEGKDIIKQQLPDLEEYISLIIVSVQLIGIFMSIFLNSWLGRRFLLLFGNASICIIDFLLVYLFLNKQWQPSSALIVILLALFMFVYGLALGSVVWLYVPEIVPAHIAPIATSTHWIAEAICIIVIPIGKQANDNNPDIVFALLGILMLILFITNYFFVVQTKERQVEQIQKQFLAICGSSEHQNDTFK